MRTAYTMPSDRWPIGFATSSINFSALPAASGSGYSRGRRLRCRMYGMSFAAPARAGDLSLKGVPTPERTAQPEGRVGIVAPREAAAVRSLFGADDAGVHGDGPVHGFLAPDQHRTRNSRLSTRSHGAPTTASGSPHDFIFRWIRLTEITDVAGPAGWDATAQWPRLQVPHGFRCAFTGRVSANDSVALYLMRLPFDHVLGSAIFGQANHQADPTAVCGESFPVTNLGSLGGRPHPPPDLGCRQAEHPDIISRVGWAYGVQISHGCVGDGHDGPLGPDAGKRARHGDATVVVIPALDVSPGQRRRLG